MYMWGTASGRTLTVSFLAHSVHMYLPIYTHGFLPRLRCATYSASADESATQDCFMNFHLTVLSPILTIYAASIVAVASPASVREGSDSWELAF